MKYLGIDFGLKHLGLALAEGPLAEPLGEKKYSRPEGLFNYLNSIIVEQQIDKVIIGLPEGKLAGLVKNFGKKLAELTGREVFFQDETLSTQEAKAKLMAAHAPQKKRRFDHSAAAALILQDYLDRIN